MFDEIKSFDPFYASYVNFDGIPCEVTFVCPYCRSPSVRRTSNSTSRHLFEGNFRCLRCSRGSLDGFPFCYYSPCFIYSSLPIQLSLFND